MPLFLNLTELFDDDRFFAVWRGLLLDAVMPLVKGGG